MMPTDDVLERAEAWATAMVTNRVAQCPAHMAVTIIRDLTPALRSARERIAELERDRARLDSALGRGWINACSYSEVWGWEEHTIETREQLDEAIGPFGGAMAAERGGE